MNTPASPPPPQSLTADVNALAWGQFHLRGGWPRLWGFAGFYVAAVGALLALASLTGNVVAGLLKFALTGVQAGILVLFVGGRVSTAIRQDLTSRMIESHRLMPLSPAQAVLGYLLGPAAHPLALALGNVVLGLFLSAAGGVPAAVWLTANAVLLEFAAFIALCLAFGAFSGKGSSAMVWLGFFIGIYSHAVIGFILPALNVLATPLAGRTVFNLGVVAGDAVQLYAPAAVFHVWFGAICFAGACRRYRRDDRLALGMDLGLALLAAWVATSAFAILRWEDYRPTLISRETVHREVQVIGSLAAAMLVGIIPLNGAAFAASDWATRRGLADPSLGRRPVPPLMVAVAGAVVCLMLTLIAIPGAASHGTGSADWGVPRDVLSRAAVVLFSFFVATLYVLRLFYRRTGSPQFPLVWLWLFLTWLLPIMVDTTRWYLSRGQEEALGAAASFSPLGAVIQLWTGRAGTTTGGIAFQVILAAGVAALFHLTNRRPTTPTNPAENARSTDHRSGPL